MSELSTSDIVRGSYYSFEVYPRAILPGRFNHVKVLSILDAQTARALGSDIESLHANVYPTLPQGTLDDPYAYSYLYVQHTNGNTAIVGEPWIRKGSLEVSGNQRLTMVFEDKSPKDIQRIREALDAIGMIPTTSYMDNG